VGSAIETEVWQPGKVLNKNTNHTYPDVMNYWAPLETIKEEDDTEPEHINSITTFNKIKTKLTQDKLVNKWTRRP
jgi:hypothetical protein